MCFSIYITLTNISHNKPAIVNFPIWIVWIYRRIYIFISTQSAVLRGSPREKYFVIWYFKNLIKTKIKMKTHRTPPQSVNVIIVPSVHDHTLLRLMAPIHDPLARFFKINFENNLITSSQQITSPIVAICN